MCDCQRIKIRTLIRAYLLMHGDSTDNEIRDWINNGGFYLSTPMKPRMVHDLVKEAKHKRNCLSDVYPVGYTSVNNLILYGIRTKKE